MDPVADDYLHRVVNEAQTVLGDDLVGVYAAGSVALDAYEPARSDIDVVLVCREPLSVATKHRLVDRLRHESLPCPARGLELVVHRLGVARAASPDPGFELELNTGAAMAHRVSLRPEDRPEIDGHFWYGIDRSILHQHGRTLFGPPAPEVFTDLRPEDLTALLTSSLRWWIERTPAGPGPTAGADEAVLGAARALVRHRTGGWTSKAGAVDRLAAEGHVATDLLRQAAAARRGGPLPDGDDARAFQAAVLREISEAAGPHRPVGGT